MGAATTLLSRDVQNGQEVWRFNNGRLRAEILPGLGGKIWTLEDAERGIQWIWHNENLSPAPPQKGGTYDDNWAGGWEDLFPNDAPGAFDGRELPDHGEWWSKAWTAEIAEDSSRQAQIRLRLKTNSVAASCEKTITLKAGVKELTVLYRVQNLEKKPLRFMLKQHLAAAVRPGDRIELPGGSMRPVDLAFSSRLGEAGPFAWPLGLDKNGRGVDISLLPPAGWDREFVYVCDLPEGWAGIRRPDGAGLRMSFDPKAFPHCWLFMDFGGWRGHYTAVLEPCTNWPKDLSQAAAAGRCACLPPGGTFETAVEVSLS
ncbi:MAG: hypothetical protein HY921_12965 [Elusimicrobia bacterium]|nr:hypothetical protein [Elusimicrobiota bacterium]